MASNKETSWLKERISCSMCGKIFDKPYTLPCLHTLCSGCTDDLKPTIQDTREGFLCPLCGQFCPKEDIRHDFLISELLDFYGMMSKRNHTNVVCKQCNASEATHHCADCKCDFCETCLEDHNGWRNMASHHVIILGQEAQPQRLVVERKNPCTKHKNKFLEMNCASCETLICVLCKAIDHEDHDCESIDDALSRVLPNIMKTKDSMESTIENIESETLRVKDYYNTLDALETEINAIHKKRQQMLDNDLDTLLFELNTRRDKINKQEEAGIHLINNHIYDAKHVLKCVDTTMATAKGTFLLYEFQSSLRAKLEQLEEASNMGRLETAASIQDPSIMIAPQSLNENMIGELEGLLQPSANSDDVWLKVEANINRPDTTPTVESVINESECQELKPQETSKLWSFPFEKLLNSRLNRMVSIQIQTLDPNKINLVNDEIWILADGYSFSPCVRVYTKGGVKINKIKLPSKLSRKANVSRAVAQYQTRAQSIVAVASDRGLYTASLEGKMIETLQLGKFSDVCIYNGYMYAFEYTQCRIYIFQADVIENQWNLLKTIQHGFIPEDFASATTIAVTPSQDALYLYDQSRTSDIITKYSLQDHSVLGTYGIAGKYNGTPGALYDGKLCGCDIMGHLLVCDSGHKRLQSLSTDGSWAPLPGLIRDYYPEHAMCLGPRTYCVLGKCRDGTKLFFYDMN